MKSLHKLDLSNNRLSGDIPLSIFINQSSFGMLDVSNNHLEGLVPFSIFANQSGLIYIDLSNNYNLEVETESPSWVPTFALTFLGLGNCNLNEKSGHLVPSFIYSQPRLQWLDLSHNSLGGSIPPSLFHNNSITRLFLRGNKFESFPLGCHGSNGTSSSLQSLDISANHVGGPLPECIDTLFPGLNHINLSSNAMQGSIISSLAALYLEILDLSNNMFSGEIPQQLTTTGSKLVYLNLSNNRLHGEMLPRDSNMTDLECLQLSGNHFRGVISPAISRSPSLVILDVRNNYLSGNIPSWLYNHPRLVAVLLGGNNFEGHIRRQICGMKTLQVLDISKNHLQGGLPSCLDNITFWKQSPPVDTNYFTQNGRLYFYLNPPGQPTVDFFDIGTDFLTKNVLYSFKGLPLTLMTGINLSWNRLTGYVPSKLGDLSQLRSLNLSHNLLTGNIPTSFQNLKSMESLDLSHNNLSGDIPYPMAKLSSLSSFSVAYNNLSGRIPSDGQFSTFDMNCYIGNPLLCGDPLPQICYATNSLERQNKDQEKEDSVLQSNLFFYGFVVVSYAFGLWVFFGVLIINKRWREIYFSTVDRHIPSFFGQK